jgi:hypothetical protein
MSRHRSPAAVRRIALLLASCGLLLLFIHQRVPAATQNGDRSQQRNHRLMVSNDDDHNATTTTDDDHHDDDAHHDDDSVCWCGDWGGLDECPNDPYASDDDDHRRLLENNNDLQPPYNQFNRYLSGDSAITFCPESTKLKQKEMLAMYVVEIDPLFARPCVKPHYYYFSPSCALHSLIATNTPPPLRLHDPRTVFT